MDAAPHHRRNDGMGEKEGARVKARVLTVDSAAKQATLTLKRSMVNDKRPAITSYEHVSSGEYSLSLPYSLSLTLRAEHSRRTLFGIRALSYYVESLSWSHEFF